MNYWLFKSEPKGYSIDDLYADQTTHWDGVRNYQARNMMRDEVAIGDMVLFYHSNAGSQTGIVGTARVTREGYGDHTAMDVNSDHYDSAHTDEHPLWYMVDIAYVSRFARPVLLSGMKDNPHFSGSRIVMKGNRLSLFPVEKQLFDTIVQMGS